MAAGSYGSVNVAAPGPGLQEVQDFAEEDRDVFIHHQQWKPGLGFPSSYSLDAKCLPAGGIVIVFDGSAHILPG